MELVYFNVCIILPSFYNALLVLFQDSPKSYKMIREEISSPVHKVNAEASKTGIA